MTRPPESAAKACAAQKSHAPLRGELNRRASNCHACGVPVERVPVKGYEGVLYTWRAFCWTYTIPEDPI